MYLGVLEALRCRLLGQSFDFVPPYPESSAKAWNIDTLEKGKAGVRNEDVIGPLAVPVIYFDYYGHSFEEVYPALTFECINVQPRPGNFLAFDPYGVGVEGSIETVDDDGTEVTGYGLLKTRNIELPYDYMVEIRAYAKDPTTSAKLVEWVSRRLPFRHYLRVPQKDGSYRSWNIIQQNFQDLDRREAVIKQRGLEREYAKVWTFIVEGYLDNTDEVEFVNTARERRLNVLGMPKEG